jgi:flagellar biosynthesis protein FlhG
MLDQATRLREIAEQHCMRPRGSKPHIVTVASGKGGVGKSTVALNLAVSLAQSGHRTLLFDADENLGSIDVMAGLSPVGRLGDVLRGERDLADVLLSPLQNLSILPGSSGDMHYVHMSIEQQKEILRDCADLETPFDFMVIDTSAGLRGETINLTIQSHEVLIVTVPQPTALMDAYALVKMITLHDTMIPLKVVVNYALSSEEGEETACTLQQAVRHFLNRDVHYLGSIPYDTSVADAIMRQSALMCEFPLSGAALSVQLMAERIAERALASGVRRFQAL